MKSPLMNGMELAETVYGSRRADTYQVRDTSGHKLAQYDNPEETLHFLRKRNRKGVEVWLLKGFPGELIEITNADNFLDKY